MNLEAGSTIGDYEITGILGAGGMGKVYKVRNMISDRVEAMKVLLPDLAHEPELADRFVREIKVQASLEHPNIAALHTALRVENQLLMLMELVEGVTLDQRLQQGPIPVDEAVDYIRQVLSALDYAHRRGVVHRDIKPANMMLTANGVVKLMDFGIAKAANDRKLTMTGTTVGSLYYMSPEQIKGATELDARSDLYSVGVSLYELVTGKRPFDGDSQFAIMSAHLEKTPVPPVTIDPRLPEALNDIILLSVGKEPASRFQTAEAFRNALLSLRPAPATVAQPKPANVAPAAVPPQPAAVPQKRSHRGLYVAAGAVFTALVVVALIQFGPWKKTSASGSAPETTAPAAAAPIAAPVGEPAPAPAAAPAAAPQQWPQATSAPADPSVNGTAIRPVQTRQTPPPPPPQRAVPVAAKSVTPPPVPAKQIVAPQAAPAQVSAPAVPAAPPVAPPPAQPDAAAAAAARRAELQQVRENLVELAARANSISASLANIQRSQAAGGLSLRGDMAEAASLMKTYLDGANAALNAGDAPSAKNFMKKAEYQIQKLEGFLNR
ncbi:MAG: serine/threonine protein kinase [Acidobacteria bacterium]|nr:serine/threonine protein kinase [Acidobacteriota bacterium]